METFFFGHIVATKHGPPPNPPLEMGVGAHK
jgi:hypothetical protein